MTGSELDHHYRSTVFRVDGPAGPIDIRVGEPVSGQLQDVLDAHVATTAAYLTAWNPGSERLTDADNARRHRELLATLETSGYRWLPGRGQATLDPGWLPEESVLVPGISRSHADRIAERFGQNCYVYVETGTSAQLVYTTLGTETTRAKNK